MREKKFRAFDKYTGKMIVTGFHIFGEYTEFDLIRNWLHEHPNPNYKSSLLRYNDVEITEYTGLKDKNEVEIYEGDKFRVGRLTDVLTVEFLNGCFGYFFYKDFIPFSKTFEKIGSEIEVIGNIYQKERK